MTLAMFVSFLENAVVAFPPPPPQLHFVLAHIGGLRISCCLVYLHEML